MDENASRPLKMEKDGNTVSATFHDLQEAENLSNGAVLDDPASVSKLFESLSQREPFVFELRGHTGSTASPGGRRGSGWRRMGHYVMLWRSGRRNCDPAKAA